MDKTALQSKKQDTPQCILLLKAYFLIFKYADLNRKTCPF